MLRGQRESKQWGTVHLPRLLLWSWVRRWLWPAPSKVPFCAGTWQRCSRHLGISSVFSTNLLFLSRLNIWWVERKEGSNVFVEIWREWKALVVEEVIHELKVKQMVDRSRELFSDGSCEVHIYMLVKKEKIPLSRNKETQTYCGFMGDFSQDFQNVVNSLNIANKSLSLYIWESQIGPYWTINKGFREVCTFISKFT